MTGMNSLSGYMYTTNGHTLAFALFINRTPGSSAGPGRPLLDALCTYLLQLNPGSNRLARVFAPHGRVEFQSHPTEGDVQRAHQGTWRRLESNVRLALKGQAVTVLYRNKELIIADHQADAGKVWAALKSIATKHPFSVALSASVLPVQPATKPKLLWIQAQTETNSRTWTIREAV
jgi:D-alanyl-D-alanine carboxypeptidase/D-alanyl-D-alanine-endopeptidase (penicillin-binding protein 4)